MTRVWQDRIVEKPRTFTVQNNADGTITLIPAPGTIVQAGTPVNAVNLNGIESDLAEKASTAQGTFTDTTTSVSPGSTYTKTIPLGFNAKQGKLRMQLSTGGTYGYVWNDIEFSNNINDTIAIGYLGSSNPYFTMYSKTLPCSYSAANGALTFPYAGGNSIVITDCYISGSNLLIVFKNTDTTNTKTMNINACKWGVIG